VRLRAAKLAPDKGDGVTRARGFDKAAAQRRGS
jgi:hypothetical protein